MWTGALFNVETLVTGALLIAIGLSFTQAALLIILGKLSYVLGGLSSLQGPKAGTSTFAVSRAPFGQNGARAVSVFNWITMIGYETLGLSLVVLAGLALLDKAGLHSSTALKVILILVATALQFAIPLYGPATIAVPRFVTSFPGPYLNFVRDPQNPFLNNTLYVYNYSNFANNGAGVEVRLDRVPTARERHLTLLGRAPESLRWAHRPPRAYVAGLFSARRDQRDHD